MGKEILIVLDRDGTISYDPGYFGKDNNWKDETRLIEGVVEGIKKLNETGVKIIVASNQAGVAREYFDCERVEEINGYFDSLLRKEGAIVDGWYYCPYVGFRYAGEKGVRKDSIWIRETDLRKPGIGMIKQACNDLGLELEDCFVYFIGDHLNDINTGLNANGKGILVLSGHGMDAEKEVRILKEKYEDRVFIAENFLSAVNIILEDIKILR